MECEDYEKGAVRFYKYIIGLTSLDMLLHCLKTIQEKETYWQWVYISLHSAVQAYMVLALTGTNSLMTYKANDMKEWIKNYDARQELPEVKLDFFENLYDKTKTLDIITHPNAKPFVPSGSQDENIKYLNKLRNNFVHFLSDSLLHFLGDSPYRLVTDCLDYIEFLAFQSNNIFWFEEQYKNETARLLSECRASYN